MKHYGGKGANQAVAAARLERKVILCGMIGNDTFGHDYKRQLQLEGCGVDNILQCSQHTGIASITVESSSGANTIVVTPGANFELREDQIAGFRAAIQKSNMLICQNELRIDRTIQALKIGREVGCLTIFNPAPAHIDCFGAIPFSDIICPNEVELSLLTSLPVSSHEEIMLAATTLQTQQGARTVVITLGSRGACVLTEQGEFHSIPAPHVTSVDTVGAGDCFIG